MTFTQQLDDLESQLALKLQSQAAAYREAPLPKASLLVTEIVQLEKDQLALQDVCSEIEQGLKQLSAAGNHELTSLYLNFEPLKQRLEHMQAALTASAEFSQLEQKLQKEIAEVKDASIALAKQFLPNHLPKFEAGLEQFRDRCDSVADQLDAIESQGHDISVLIPLYEQWMAWIERFGEILDERIEALRID